MEHHSGLRITRAHPRLALGLFSALALLQLLQLLQCVLQPLLLLVPRASLRLLCFRTALFIVRIAHLCHALSRPRQMLTNRSFPLITPRARQRFDFRAVLHHLLQRDQPLFAEGRRDLNEQLVQLALSVHAKIRQRVVVHLLQSRQPLKRRINPHRRATSRAEPIPSLYAYTHKLISSCGSNAGRPPSSTRLPMSS